jgi:hypothetical protein
LWHEHGVRTEQWERDRQTAYATAASAAHDLATREGRGGPSAHDEAQTGGTTAAARSERSKPVPLFENVATTKLWFEA